MGDESTQPPVPPRDADMATLLTQLEDLERTVDSAEERREVRRAIRIARHVPGSAVFGRTIRGYTTRDMAQAFVGSVVFGLPLLVEDGVFEIADHFASVFVAGVPASFLANALFVTLLVIGLLYYAQFQRVEITRPVFGIVPRRLIGVLGISFLSAALLMTMWGRIGWEDPWIAVCRISVIWTAMAIGASLGDILPGESEENHFRD